ncbi:MAG TPA: membrane trafficking protein [Pseudobacteroides sp.]|uniref:membrane trafficking protein n=1 Tax=Pseudobacteroides sp. TaxID=1968840 RepID=UPI002F9214E0
MNNPFNKKLSELLSKMDDKVLQAKLNSAMDMLQNGNAEELAKRLNKVDKEELLGKINEIDDSKLKSLNLDKAELTKRLNDQDLSKLSAIIGDRGDEIISKIKELINKS